MQALISHKFHILIQEYKNHILLNNILPNSNNALSICGHCVHCLNMATRFFSYI